MVSECLLISNEKERRRIYLHAILYIKTDDYLSTFFLTNNEKFVCSKPLNELANYLPDHFFQISRAQIVNLNEISSVRRGSKLIRLNDSTELTVSFRRRKSFNIALTSNNITFTR